MLQKNLHTIVTRLALLSAFCFFIEVFRIFFAGDARYIFLGWNLILAWIPLWLATQVNREAKSLRLLLYLGAWLAFFPNAPYLITDLLHLKPHYDFPFWYDVLLLYCYAFTGLLAGMVSALVVFKKLATLFAPWKAKSFMLLSMLLSGYGIYMGRFLRYNSWDVLVNPMQIITDTASRIIHPAAYPGTYGVTLMSGILLSLVLFIFESFLPAE